MTLNFQSSVATARAVNRSENARRESVTRARVCEIMSLLRLAPAIQKHILIGRLAVAQQCLRRIVQVPHHANQISTFTQQVENLNPR